MSSPELVQDMRRTLRGNVTGAAAVELLGPCRLAIQWKGEPSAVVYSLQHVRLDVSSEKDGGRLKAYFTSTERPGDGPRLLLSTPEWVALASVRSDLNQLRARCFDTGPPLV